MDASRVTLVDMSDRLALLASGACMAHCLAIPLLFVLFPLLPDALRLPEAFHLVMVALAIPSSTYALLTGFKQHRSAELVITGIIGLLLLIAGATLFGETRYETPITVAAALILATVHIFNWKRRHRGL